MLFSILNSFSRPLSVRIHIGQVLFFQGFFAILFLSPYLFRTSLIPQRFGLHLVRDIAGTMSFVTTFLAARKIAMVDAMLLASANALWVPLILLVWFRQRIPFKLMACLLAGFVGVVLILRPGSELFELASIYGVLGGLLMGIAMVSLRQLSQTEPMPRIIFYYCACSVVLGGCTLPFVWVTPTWAEWAFLAGIGACIASTQLMLTRAYTLAPASRLSPFSYTVVLFAGCIDWICWDKLPDLVGISGALLVIVAALLTIYIKTDKKLG